MDNDDKNVLILCYVFCELVIEKFEVMKWLD